MNIVLLIIALFVKSAWGTGPALIVYFVGRIIVYFLKCIPESQPEPQTNDNQNSYDNYYYQNAGYQANICGLETYYEILGISSNATDREVKHAYLELVRKNHPDLVGNQGEEVRQIAEKKMQEINIAYENIKYWRGIN